MLAHFKEPVVGLCYLLAVLIGLFILPILQQQDRLMFVVMVVEVSLGLVIVDYLIHHKGEWQKRLSFPYHACVWIGGITILLVWIPKMPSWGLAGLYVTQGLWDYFWSRTLYPAKKPSPM